MWLSRGINLTGQVVSANIVLWFDYLFGGNGNLDGPFFKNGEAWRQTRASPSKRGPRAAFPKFAGPNPSTSKLWWVASVTVVAKIGSNSTFCTVRLFGIDAADRKWHSLARTSDLSTKPHHASRTAYGDNMFIILDAITPLTDFPYMR